MKQKASNHYQFDKLDKQIIEALMENALIPYSELAKKLLVSNGTIHVRMRKLEEAGAVGKAQLNINPSKIGYDITAFLGIFLDKGSDYHESVIKMRRISEITELHYTTGTYSMFAKVVCKDTEHLRQVLNEKIQTIKGVSRTETFISLEESIRRQVKLS